MAGGTGGLATCEPKKLRCTDTSRPPTSSWPPSFCPSTSFARKIRPAHVPITGLPLLTKARSGSSKPSRSARWPIVVLSPPGTTRPSSVASRSCTCRTSVTLAPSLDSITMCSWKPPCSASTPIAGASLLVTVVTVSARLVTVRTSVMRERRERERAERSAAAAERRRGTVRLMSEKSNSSGQSLREREMLPTPCLLI